MFVPIKRTEDVTSQNSKIHPGPRMALVGILKKTIIRTLMTINIINVNNALFVLVEGFGFH